MSDDHRLVSGEKVEHPVIDMSVSNTKFIDPVSEIIGFGASEFMTQLDQPVDPSRTLVPDLDWKLIEPVEDGDGFIIILVQYDLDPRQ